jgi:hypothetical protein
MFNVSKEYLENVENLDKTIEPMDDKHFKNFVSELQNQNDSDKLYEIKRLKVMGFFLTSKQAEKIVYFFNAVEQRNACLALNEIIWDKDKSYRLIEACKNEGDKEFLYQKLNAPKKKRGVSSKSVSSFAKDYSYINLPNQSISSHNVQFYLNNTDVPNTNSINPSLNSSNNNSKTTGDNNSVKTTLKTANSTVHENTFDINNQLNYTNKSPNTVNFYSYGQKNKEVNHVSIKYQHQSLNNKISNNLTPQKVLSEEEVEGILQRMLSASFKDKMIEELRISTKEVFLTANNAAKLVKIFTFADAQEIACMILYPRLTDPHNVGALLESCTYNSTKNEVKKKLCLKF